MATPRSTTPRRHHRALCVKHQLPCAICGRPIDYTLPYMHPFEFVSDHIVPVTLGGSDTELANRQPAHRKCNAEKAEGLMDLRIKRSGALK